MAQKKQFDLTPFVRMGLAKLDPKGLRNKPHTNFGSIDQIGCGYCSKELTCKIRDPKINKAKLGCKEYEHHSEKR